MDKNSACISHAPRTERPGMSNTVEHSHFDLRFQFAYKEFD